MGEPIPSASHDPEDPPKPTNAEDRKAAAALDSLNANAMSQENGEAAGSRQPTAADQEALGKAMARLEGAIGSKGSSVKKKDEGKASSAFSSVNKDKEKQKEREEVKKKIKVDAADVQFLVSELDLSKGKATELLRNNEGVLDAAVKSFLVPSAKA